MKVLQDRGELGIPHHWTSQSLFSLIGKKRKKLYISTKAYTCYNLILKLMSGYSYLAFSRRRFEAPTLQLVKCTSLI